LTKVHRTFIAAHKRNRGRSDICAILNVFIHFGDISPQSLISSQIGPNFACFWPLIFFEGPEEILNRNHKIEHTSNHGAKFRGDRPTELGDIANKIIKKLTPLAEFAVMSFTFANVFTR